MTAVMLTGVMLLQVSLTEKLFAWPQAYAQAGRYYAKRPSSTPPPAVVDSAPTSPPTEPYRRSSTPFRELTEDEALELKGLDD